MMHIAPLDRKTLERSVAPASLHVALESLRRAGILRGYRVTRTEVLIDGDAVALELACEALEAPEFNGWPRTLQGGEGRDRKERFLEYMAADRQVKRDE